MSFLRFVGSSFSAAANSVVIIWPPGSFSAQATACRTCARHAIAGKRQTDDQVFDRPLLSACTVKAPVHAAENYHSILMFRQHQSAGQRTCRAGVGITRYCRSNCLPGWCFAQRHAEHAVVVRKHSSECTLYFRTGGCGFGHHAGTPFSSISNHAP